MSAFGARRSRAKSLGPASGRPDGDEYMLRITALSALTACIVGGCSVLPASGPTAGAIASGAETTTPEGTFARYELLDITPAVVEALRTRPQAGRAWPEPKPAGRAIRPRVLFPGPKPISQAVTVTGKVAGGAR